MSFPFPVGSQPPSAYHCQNSSSISSSADQQRNQIQFSTPEELNKFLNDHGLIYEEHVYLRLFQELNLQETVLTLDSDGNLIREVEVANIAVRTQDALGKTYELIETQQISYAIVDGKETSTILGEKARNNAFVGEKMKAGEDIKEAACRGIEEELGQKVTPDDLTLIKTELNDKNQNSNFPGLKSIYTIHFLEIEFPPEFYQQHKIGFEELEIKSNGTVAQHTYFEWREKPCADTALQPR